MSTDVQFNATGPAAAGFQTTGGGLDVGAEATGASAGGRFHATGTGGVGVAADTPTATGFLAGNRSDDPDHPEPVGAYGECAGGAGVYGNGIVGVFGETTDVGARGFLGGRDLHFSQRCGVYGESSDQGLVGLSTGTSGAGAIGVGSQVGADFSGGTGLLGTGYLGVRGETQTGVGLQGQSFGTGLAGRFVGNVSITGDLTVTGDVYLDNRDLAERFPRDTSVACENGMVMVMSDAGRLEPCTTAYDKRVIGVVSGAGTTRAAVTLGSDQDPADSAAIALAGTTWCKVDNSGGPIEVGDLVTTSATPGHGMRAADPARSFGTVLGKALAAMHDQRGLIPLLISSR
jgi:hypothetical protein